MTEIRDVIIVGAGTAGLPAGIFAAQRGADVLQVDADNRVGGTLFWSSGQMSAAGTRLQKDEGVEDSPDDHYEDAMRISHGTMDPDIGRLAIENAADTFDWLMDIGFQPLPGHPVAGQAHEPYRKRRYSWGEKLGISLLDVMKPVHDKLVAEGRISLRLSTQFRKLLHNGASAVTGIEVETSSGSVEKHYGKSVVLASGGYAANPEMWAEMTPHYTLTSRCNPYSRGDGLSAAREVGAAVSGAEHFLAGVAGYREDPDDPLSGAAYRLNPATRRPWEIYVDGEGKRFVREDHPSIDHIERAVLALPQLTLYVIFDEPMRQNAPVLNLETREQLAGRFGKHPYFSRAASLDALAEGLGMNPAALKHSVNSFNRAVETRHDPEFGREHMIRPIDQPPFYAARAVGISLVSPAGVDVDSDLRVVRADGAIIPNLYAAGEVIGFTKFSGNAFVGGMGVMPALTFGRLLGQRILSW